MPMPSEHSAAERAGLYLDFAAHALKLAQSAPTQEIRATYVSLAQCWNALAEKADRMGNGLSDDSSEAGAG